MKISIELELNEHQIYVLGDAWKKHHKLQGRFDVSIFLKTTIEDYIESLDWDELLPGEIEDGS